MCAGSILGAVSSYVSFGLDGSSCVSGKTSGNGIGEVVLPVARFCIE